MKSRIWIAVLMTSLASTGALAQKKGPTIQCWEDKDGKRMCGDRVPPEYAGQKREIIHDGRVVETKRAAKTPEEIAAEEKAAQEAEEARRRADYDRALLESYRNIDDIETARDERIAMLDMRLRAAEKSAAENKKSLEALRARAAKEDKPGPKAKLEKQVREYEVAVEESDKAVQRLSQQREDTRAKYEADANRYLELRPLTPAEAKARAAKQAAAEKKAEAAAKAEAAKAAEKAAAAKKDGG